MDRGYENLAEAIIMKGVKDYRNALKKLKEKPTDKKALVTKRECEQFFRSRWFGNLTAINPQLIIDRINKEVAS